MKHFVSHTIKENKRVYGGRNITITIHQILKNKLYYVGELKYCTASTPGVDSEIFQFLAKNGDIPKIALKKSKTSWRGEGYYTTDNKYCRITTL